MPVNGFYCLTGPQKWASPPEVFSYSSLGEIENCPLSWQLRNSTYEGFKRYPTRPQPSSVEGEIVHSILEKLFRTLARFGMPQIGSEDFQRSVIALGLSPLISKLVDEHEKRLAAHPRGAGFRLKSSVDEIHNKVIRIFRAQYENMRRNTPSIIVSTNSSLPIEATINLETNNDYIGILYNNRIITELSLCHPYLPFKGVLDFIWLDADEVCISDFKSGVIQTQHKEQLLFYALLWWRNTGKIPREVSIVCPDKSESIIINDKTLIIVEEELREKIKLAAEGLLSIPAKANIDESCKFCYVRQFCMDYWEQLPKNQHGNLLPRCGDIEVRVHGVPSEHAFSGITPRGRTVNVVYGKDVGKILGPFVPEENLKILGCLLQGETVELKSFTEVFHCR